MSQTHSPLSIPGDIIWLQPSLPLTWLTAIASCLICWGGEEGKKGGSAPWIIQSSPHSDASEVLGNTDSNLWKHWCLPIAFNPSYPRTAQNVCSCLYWTSSEPLPGAQAAWPFHTCAPQQALSPSNVLPRSTQHIFNHLPRKALLLFNLLFRDRFGYEHLPYTCSLPLTPISPSSVGVYTQNMCLTSHGSIQPVSKGPAPLKEPKKIPPN